jgi:hypothetical protein
MADDFDPYYPWLAIPPICPDAAVRTKTADTTSTWKKKE